MSETKTDATCATCPYGVRGGAWWPAGGGVPAFTVRPDGLAVQCRRLPGYVIRDVDDWCGEHPKRRPDTGQVIHLPSGPGVVCDSMVIEFHWREGVEVHGARPDAINKGE